MFDLIDHKAFFRRYFFSSLFFVFGFLLIPLIIDRTGKWGVIGRFNLPSWYYVVVISFIFIFRILAIIFIGIKYKQGAVFVESENLVFEFGNGKKIYVEDPNRIKLFKLRGFYGFLYNSKFVCLEIDDKFTDKTRVVANCKSQGQKAYFVNHVLKTL